MSKQTQNSSSKKPQPVQKPTKTQPTSTTQPAQPSKVKAKQQKFEIVKDPLLKSFLEVFNNHSNKLSRYYSRFLSFRNDWSQPLNQEQLFLKWLKYYHEKTEEQGFKGNSRFTVIPNPENICKAPDEKILFSNYDFFNILGGKWPIRFENKFIQKLTDVPAIIKDIYSLVCFIKQGLFTKVNTIHISEQTCLPYMAFFKVKVPGDKKFMLFNVGVEKVPILDKYGNSLISFEFLHYIRFLDILKENVNILTSTAKYFNQYINDPARGDFVQELVEDTKYTGGTMKLHLFTHHESVIGEQVTMELGEQVLPSKFKPIFLTKIETNSMIYDKKACRWMPSDVKLQHERQVFLSYSKKMNEELLKQYADFSSAAKLVELLEKIPNFKLKLTLQEKDVIGQSGNVLVIGRSGTGKTTCAILRIFSMEILFKIRVSLYKNKIEGLLRDTRFIADDLDKTVGLHCMFVTASPVLTTEVQRYYDRLTKHIKEELKKKQLKDKLKRQQEQEKYNKDNKEEEKSLDMTLDAKDKTVLIEEGSMVKEVENQIKDIKLEGDDGNPPAEEKDLGIDDEELQKKMLKYTSMNEMKEEDFPAFITMRNLLIMVDGALTKPFFTRNKDNQIIGGDSSAQWHNETKGVLMIDNYFRKMGEFDANEANMNNVIEEEEEADNLDYGDEEELEYAYQREMFLQEANIKKAKSNQSFVSNLKKKLSFEIDYEYFETYFWPKVLKKYQHLPITATAVWTEIYSYIKGSASSHLHPGQYLPEKLYIELLSDRKSMMDLDTKKLMFELYCMYERWKSENAGYDQLDVVNYILTQMRYGRYQGTPIHYMMVDEVQDLPHAMLLLLSQITEQGLFFSGDTAQNIAKGVGFRFCDLSHVFDKNNFPNHTIGKPIVRHLTINFRSHSRILDLANSLVSILELCFPKTIDRLKKEKSNLDGPKPMLLDANDAELLFFVLLGEADYKRQKMKELGQDTGLISRPPVEFGCNQVILVRDQKSKEKIPSILQHALCLTIYEAKGLEFDDVILFNFFADSTMEANKWGILNHLLVADKLIEKDEYLKSITMHEREKQKLEELEEKAENEEDKDDFDKLYGAKEIDGKVMTKNVIINKSFKTVDINQYSIACTELKQLYTAITRPRNKLIIFDDNLEKRDQIAQYWAKLDLIEVIHKEIIEKINATELNEGCSVKSSKEYNIFRSILQKTSNEEWRNQGLKMMKHKYYEQAIKCFEKANEEILLKRALAFHHADEATKIIAKVEAERVYIQEKVYHYTDLKKYQRKEARTRLNSQEKQAILDLKVAADNFITIDLPKQAAQCLFSAKEYKKACDIYMKLEMWTQAGEAYFILEDYKKAAECFDKTNDFIRVMECYEAMEEWEKLIEIVYKYKNQMKPQDKENYIKKFVPLALEKLVNEICFQNEVMKEEEEEEKEDGGQVIDEKAESDEEEDSEDSEEEKEEIHKEIHKEKIEKSEVKPLEINKNETSAIKIDEESKQETSKIQELSLDVDSSKLEEIPLNNKQDPTASLIDNVSSSVNNNKPQQSNQPNISFEEMNVSDVRSQLEKNEHLSNIDLNDEFIKAESGSIIESLSLIRKENSKIQSDYSSVEYSAYMGNNPNLAIVKTKTDIYAQDQTMQKIIRYISFFSEEFRAHLDLIRSKTSLLSGKKLIEGEYDDMVDFIIDLDLINLDFLHLMLDSLETFKIHKLCIFICNRYKLSNRIGRYLVSIANKYSPFAQDSVMIPMIPTHFINALNKKALMEKAFFANIALHNVLENINPNYLKLKKINEESNSSNSLGMEAFQGLIHLGFWKKCVFLTDYITALAITSTFWDFETYKMIFLTYNEAYANNQGCLECLKSVSEFKKVSFTVIPFNFPTNALELELCIISLEHINWMYTQFFTFCMSKTCVANNNKPICSMLEAFPNYFAYSGVFWRLIFNQTAEKQENLKKLFEEYLLEALKSLLKIFKKEPFQTEFLELRVYDLVLFFINVMIFGYSHQEIKKILINLPDSTIYLFTTVFEKLLEFENSLDTLNRFSDLIVRATLTAFRIRLIKDCEIFKIYGFSKAFMHRTSPIFFEVIDPLKQENNREVFPVDVDGEMFLVDIRSCLMVINTRLFLFFKEIFMRKLTRLNHIIMPVFSELCSLGWINERFHYLLNNYKFQKDRIIDDKTKRIINKYIIIDEDYEEEENNEEDIETIEKNDKKPENIVFDPETIKKDLFGFIKQSYFSLRSKDFWPVSYQNMIKNKDFVVWIINETLNVLDVGDISESEKHIKIIIGFELLRVIGRENILYELLRRKRKIQQISNYLKLIEGYWYKSFNCIEEYVDCVFEYIAKIINSNRAPFEEKIIRLTETSLSIIMAYSLYKTSNYKSYIVIPSKLKKYLPKNLNEINPLTKQRVENLVYEQFFWIKKLCSLAEKLHRSNTVRIAMILMTLIINLKTEINNEVFKEISECVESLFIYTQKYTIKIVSTLKNLCKSIKDITESAEKMVNSGNMFEKYPLEKIEISSSKAIIDKNFEDCDREWLNLHGKIANRINSKRTILRYYRKKSNIKVKKLKNPENSTILLRFLRLSFEEKFYGNLIDFFKNYAFISEHITSIESLAHDVLKTFYKNPIENSLDFHFLNRQNVYVLGIYQDLKNSIVDYMEKNNQKILFDNFVKIKKNLENSKESFEMWKSSNIKMERFTEMNMKKNRKILALKLSKKGLISRATQIAQKRAGLKKQRALKQKALMNKIMK